MDDGEIAAHLRQVIEPDTESHADQESVTGRTNTVAVPGVGMYGFTRFDPVYVAIKLGSTWKD